MLLQINQVKTSSRQVKTSSDEASITNFRAEALQIRYKASVCYQKCLYCNYCATVQQDQLTKSETLALYIRVCVCVKHYYLCFRTL